MAPLFNGLWGVNPAMRFFSLLWQDSLPVTYSHVVAAMQPTVLSVKRNCSIGKGKRKHLQCRCILRLCDLQRRIRRRIALVVRLVFERRWASNSKKKSVTQSCLEHDRSLLTT